MSFSAKKPGKTNYFKLFFTLLQNVNVFTYRYLYLLSLFKGKRYHKNSNGSYYQKIVGF